MISFDPDTRKATKCHLCNGKPKCVEACPADSLSYVPWRDLTGKIPPRVSTTARPQGDRAAACFECHLPGQRKNAGPGARMSRGGAGRASSSGPDPAFSWIDRLGTIFLPVVVLVALAHGAVRAMVKR